MFMLSSTRSDLKRFHLFYFFCVVSQSMQIHSTTWQPSIYMHIFLNFNLDNQLEHFLWQICNLHSSTLSSTVHQEQSMQVKLHK